MRNRAKSFFGGSEFVEPRPQGRSRNPKTKNPNFLSRKALIFPISAKNKFGKICKAKQSTIENKWIFSTPIRRILQKRRHPRILQGFQ
jgi:hypothetical protein